MSTNPYVSIDRVIDTSDDQRRVVDFLHQRSFVKAVQLYNTRFAAVLAGEEHEGAYYADITQDELDINFILKENHIPIIINNNSVDLTIDKDNFPSCKTIWSETEQEYVIRVYAQLQPLARLDIPVIITIEANDNYVSLEEGMRGYTNAAGGGGGTLASIAFDRDAFVQYFETLGNINDVREQMENFLSSVAYSFESGTISADKFITSGNNLMPRLSSFEDELGRAIAHYPEDPGISNLVVVGSEYTSSPSPHGDAVLRMFTDIATGPFEMLINPYVGDDSTWINIPAFDYWFSYYLYTTSPTTVDGGIQLVDESGITVKLIPFSLTQSDGWTRFSDFFTVATEKDLTIKITINQGGINLYLDAIQLENKTILNPSGPTDFAPGGKVIIEGGNIRTKSISASDAIFEDAAIVSANIDTLAANKIAAGQLNTQVVTIGDEDGLMVMADTNLTFYHPTDTEKLFPRVELGKLEDAILPEDEIWGLKIRSADGSAILLDENGLTNLGIDEGLKNAKVLTYDELNDLYEFTGEYVSVDGSTLVSESVVASKLYAGSIESDKIQTVNLAAESITAEQLNAVITTGKRIMLGESIITAGIDGAGTAASTVRFWAGQDYDNRATAPFRITQDGHLYASQGTFTGSITGASGTFGGSIKIGSGESVFKADANGIYLGNETFSSAEFRVSPAGALTATSANITGSINSGSTITGASFSGGSININNAFTVNSSGILNATGATIRGSISSGSTITGSTISGSIIDGGTIDITGGASGYSAFSIDSNKMLQLSTSGGGFITMGGSRSTHPWVSGLNISLNNGIVFHNHDKIYDVLGSGSCGISALSNGQIQMWDYGKTPRAVMVGYSPSSGTLNLYSTDEMP